MEFDYEFCVSGLTRDQADALREIIESFVVVGCAGLMGGGFTVAETESEDGSEND